MPARPASAAPSARRPSWVTTSAPAHASLAISSYHAVSGSAASFALAQEAVYLEHLRVHGTSGFVGFLPHPPLRARSAAALRRARSASPERVHMSGLGETAHRSTCGDALHSRDPDKSARARPTSAYPAVKPERVDWHVEHAWAPRARSVDCAVHAAEPWHAHAGPARVTVANPQKGFRCRCCLPRLLRFKVTCAREEENMRRTEQFHGVHADAIA